MILFLFFALSLSIFILLFGVVQTSSLGYCCLLFFELFKNVLTLYLSGRNRVSLILCFLFVSV